VRILRPRPGPDEPNSVKTYGLKDEDGRVRAFEVSNFILGRHGVCRVVRTIPA